MKVFLGLGSNLGNRERNLRLALRMLESEARVVRVSSVYETAAVVLEGEEAGPDFLNAACEIETELSPHELLAFVKEIEREIGRRPAGRWAARPIDIDILLYGNEVVETETLVIPHPMLHGRDFVLAPLSEIAGEVVHPVGGRTIADVAAEVGGEGLVLTNDAGWVTA